MGRDLNWLCILRFFCFQVFRMDIDGGGRGRGRGRGGVPVLPEGTEFVALPVYLLSFLKSLVLQVCGMRYKEVLKVKPVYKKYQRFLTVKNLSQSSTRTPARYQACPWVSVVGQDEVILDVEVGEVVGDVDLKEMRKARIGNALLAPTLTGLGDQIATNAIRLSPHLPWYVTNESNIDVCLLISAISALLSLG